MANQKQSFNSYLTAYNTAGSQDLAKLWLISAGDELLLMLLIRRLRQTLQGIEGFSEVFEGTEKPQVGALFQGADLFGDRCSYLIHRVDAKYCDIVCTEFGRAKSSRNTVVLSLAKPPSPKLLKSVGGTRGVMVVHTESPEMREYLQVISFLASTLDLNLTGPAAQALLEMTGHDTDLIYQQLQFLRLYAGQSKQVSPEDVRKACGFLREDLSFRLRDYLLESKLAEALTLGAEISRRGESILAVLGIITKHLRNALSAFEPGSGINSYLLNRYQSYARRMTRTRLERALNVCAQADQLLKSTRVGDDLILARVLTECV
jgi:DNA polymerase III delta subunit